MINKYIFTLIETDISSLTANALINHHLFVGSAGATWHCFYRLLGGLEWIVLAAKPWSPTTEVASSVGITDVRAACMPETCNCRRKGVQKTPGMHDPIGWTSNFRVRRPKKFFYKFYTIRRVYIYILFHCVNICHQYINQRENGWYMVYRINTHVM